MTRLWPNGDPIVVTANQRNIPLDFTWGGRKHRVQAVADTWRVDAEWWRSRIWREYYKLTTVTGLLVIVYYDLAEAHWYLHRLYD